MVRSLFLALLVALTLTACEPQPVPLTQDRMSPEQLDALVAGPLVLIQRGDVPASETAFADLLARAQAQHGVRSVREFDLLTAFGVALHRERSNDRAQPYLKRAIDAARAAFGSRHAETALALHTYGSVLDPRSNVVPPAEAVAAVEDALSIRREALGSDNIETLATIEQLARLKIRTAKATGDRRVAAQAETLILEVMPAAEEDQQEHLSPPGALRRDLAQVYAVMGRGSELMRMVEEDIRAQSLPETAGWGAMIDLFRRKTSELFGGQEPGSLPRNCLMFLDIEWGETLTILEKRDRATAQSIRNRKCKPPNDAAI